MGQRMKSNKALLLPLFAILSWHFMQSAHCAVPFSDYGMIQNVQTYSSNPFYNKDAAYNQRMPTPVYALGPSVETSDCQTIVFTLIATQCSTMNNCISKQLSDIRPTVMLQLSRLPGGNYATSCAGFLDTAFEQYRKQYGHAGATAQRGTFPVATTPNPNANGMGNNVTVQFPKPAVPEWKSDMEQRRAEIQELQSEMYSAPELTAAQFPKTADDLSFTERMAIKAAGYEPFKDSSAYQQIEIEDEATYLERRQQIEQARLEKECLGNPNSARCKTTSTQNQQNGPTTPNLIDNPVDTKPNEILFYL